MGSKFFGNSISSFSIITIMVAISLVGIATIPLLTIQPWSTRTISSVDISCSLPNASPQLMEMEVTTPIESTVNNLKGVIKISSTSSIGTCMIRVDLDKWTDPEMFRLEIAAVVRQLYKKLPNGLSYPQIKLNQPSPFLENDESIVGYTLSGPSTQNVTADLAKEIFKPQIAKISGLQTFQIDGSKNKQVVILVDAVKMKAIGLNYENLKSQLSLGLKTQDIGIISTGLSKQNLAIKLEISNLKALSRFRLIANNDRLFFLSDIATIKVEQEQLTSYYRVNGEELVTLSFFAGPKVNTIRLSHEIQKVMENLKNKLPNGYMLRLSYDKTDYMKAELNKIYIRTGMSIFILLLFVLIIARQSRYLTIVLVTLIANILVSCVFYFLLDLQIHLYTIAGITVSLGLIIDNVIITIEDIRQKGNNKIFAAILASTITAICALSVIFLFDEKDSINLMDFAMAILISLLVSLPIAYFFLPALIEVLPLKNHQPKTNFKRIRKIVILNNFNKKFFHFMVNYKRAFFFVLIMCFGIPLFLLPAEISNDRWFSSVYAKTFGSEFYRQNLKVPLINIFGGAWFLYYNSREQKPVDENDNSDKKTRLNIAITMPNGANVEQMNKVCVDFDNYLKHFRSKFEIFTTHVNSGNSASITVVFKDSVDYDFPYELKRMLETKAILAGSADFEISGVGQGFSNVLNLNKFDSTITLKGYDLEMLKNFALQIRDSLISNPRTTNVLITTRTRWSKRIYSQYVINLNNSKNLIQSGISGDNFKNAIGDIKYLADDVGEISLEGDHYSKVLLYSHKNDLPEIWKASHQPIEINDSTTLKLNQQGTIEMVSIGEDIIKVNQEYVLNVHYQFTGSAILNYLIKERLVKSFGYKFPLGYSIFGDEDESSWNDDANDYYIYFLPLIILIIYMVCAALMESLSQPIAIILLIPFSFIGVFLIFSATNLQFGQGGYAALVMLSCTVSNAGLYIVDELNLNRMRYKTNVPEQIKLYLKAFNSKVIPIIVTTLSAVLSMIPFILAGDEDKGFWFTLSVGTIGGLFFSILGTYILLPLCLIKRVSKLSRKL